ncbi:MAG TPA: hypothetical protein VE075_07820 [Thermoanaerobaculia bacterium]|nr:hypothetical protein [Thermoanaerobaculia bacterium]
MTGTGPDASKRSSLPVAGRALRAILGWVRSTGPPAATPAGGAAAGASSASSPLAPAAATQSRSPGQPAAPEPWREPLRLYDEFFGLAKDPAPAPKRAAAIDRLQRRIQERPPGAGPDWQPFQLQFMVALVPDPLESQIPAAFDQAIDAIEQGFAYSHRNRKAYLPDRSWIPWNDDQAVKDKTYQASPGLLLFRRWQHGRNGLAERQLMGVFLVGETPKPGIHKAAFHEALQLIAELSPPGAPGPVKILGPSYSGSAVSLRTALVAWTGERRTAPAAATASRFLIVSGSARAPCLETLFRFGTPQAVTFYRAVVPLDVLLHTALADLHDHMGWDLRKTALITELDTAFGQSVQQPGSEALQLCQAQPVDVGAVVRFPSHIATIRTARAVAGLDKAAPDPNQLGSRPATADLQLNLADRPGGADRVPDFSPLTAPANEIAITGLVNAMARDGIRYVGILATDVRDTLFLADRIRSQSRNVTLFALEADQLFLHPQVHAAVNGMTVLSSSPLLIAGRLREDASGRQQGGAAGSGDSPWQLASSVEHGIFQAVVELLSDLPLDRVAANDAGPVWISVVGDDAIWPIRGKMTGKSGGDPQPEQVLSFERLVHLELGKAGDDPASGSSLAAGEDVTQADLELLFFAVLLCFGAWFLHRAALLPVPSNDAGAENGTRRLLAAGIAALALGGATLVALGLLAHSRQDRLQPAAWTRAQRISVAGLVLAYLFLIAAVVCAVAVRRSPGGGRPRFRRWGAALVTLAAGLAAVPALAWAICARWMLCGVYFDERVRAFASGVSPLISVAWLIGALYLWAFLELKRRRLTAWQQIDWPLAETFEPAFKGSSRLLDTIRWLLAAAFVRSRWRQAALAVMIVAALCLVWGPMQPAAEKREFGQLMVVLWMVPAVLSAISCYRLVEVWRALRKLLVRIGATPLANRLATLSQDLRWKPMQALTWPIPPFETLILSLVRLKELRRAGTVTLTDTEVADLDNFVGLAFEAEAREKAGVEILNRERLEHLIAKVGAQLASHRDQPGVEDFFAIRVAAYLRYVFAQLRSSLMSALGPALLVLLAVAAYTFEPKGTVSLGLLALVIAEIVVAVSIFVAMNRDTVLSLIAGNPPGEITFDWHFVSSLLTFGVLPLLALIGTQIPAAGQLLNGWLKPLLHLTGAG